MMKKVPQRMCISCRTRRDKPDFIRFVAAADGTVLLDQTGKAAGRGAYICKTAACLETALRTRQLERHLSRKLDEETVRMLLAEKEKLSVAD